MTSRPGPDFFIVGAPKSGTTSLDGYLGEHPDIFMAPKEAHFFGSDLAEVWNHPGAGHKLSDDEYFALFAGGDRALRRGEASVWYLWSRSAAQEICDYNPEARIIVMLRNPVEMLPSLHSQYLYDQIENLDDFAEALDAEHDRRSGRRIPPNNGPHPWRLFYRQVARFHEQLERYHTVFGRHRVQVILFDDFASDTGATYRRVLEFLDVDPSFVPSLRVMNSNKRSRSRWLKQRVMEARTPPSPIWRAGTRLAPMNTRRRTTLRGAANVVARLNTASPPRSPIDSQLRLSLAAELAPDIERLAALLGRDLSHWHSREPADPRLDSEWLPRA